MANEKQGKAVPTIVQMYPYLEKTSDGGVKIVYTNGESPLKGGRILKEERVGLADIDRHSMAPEIRKFLGK